MEGDATLSRRIARLNMHSIGKKSARYDKRHFCLVLLYQRMERTLVRSLHSGDPVVVGYTLQYVTPGTLAILRLSLRSR
jgi:hypothetical protein